MSISLYGASGDRIVVQGDINETWFATTGYENYDGDLIAFSDGTLLRIAIDDDDVWRIEPMRLRDPDLLTITKAGENGTTDYLEFRTNDIDWIVFGTSVAQNPR